MSDHDATAETDAAGPYFLSLGAGPHQVPLIAAARRLGFPVIAVDRNLRAPGFEDAAVRLQCSTNRPRRIAEMLGQYNHALPLAGIGCRSFGPAGVAAGILAQKFGLPGNPPRSLRRFRNKRRLKALLAAHGVPVPHSYGFGSLAAREELRRAQPPLLLRPAGGHGKLGLRLLESEADIQRFLQIHLRDNEQILLEEMIHGGNEVTVLGMVENGCYTSLCFTDKLTSPAPPLFIELGHHFPARISETERQRMDTILQTIVDATGLVSGAFVAEFLLRGETPGDRAALLVECAPEIGGEYLADVLLPAAIPTAPPYFDELVRLYTGDNFKTRLYAETLASPTRSVSIRFVAQGEGTLAELELPETITAHADVLFAKLLKEPGQQVTKTGGNPDRLAVLAVHGPIERDAELQALADDFAAQIARTAKYGG